MLGSLAIRKLAQQLQARASQRPAPAVWPLALPALVIGAYRLGGEPLLIWTVIILPILWMAISGLGQPMRTGQAKPDRLTGLRHPEAQRYAPTANRSCSPALQHKSSARQKLTLQAHAACEEGQIQAWFQPQLSTETGQLTGFEALARWQHPQRGLLLPAAFLDIFKNSGRLARLGDEMLDQALIALTKWHARNIKVPQVGVNFTGEELRNPRLIDKIQWKLDQYGLAPSCLAVEILETVVAQSPDDIVARNINGLAKLGCHIDLDDFGTGHASISSIRRFAVSRLKIDRSFVTRADRDADQEHMVHAILTMAEKLRLDTLAEGVETTGEHAILAQLGCNHVQGFGIARPMPLQDSFAWVRRHNAKLPKLPDFGQKTG